MKIFFSYYCICSSLLYFLFGIFCFCKNRTSLVNRLWSLSSVAIAIWSFGLGMMTNASKMPEALFWLRIHYVGAVLIPPFFYHYIASFINQNVERQRFIRFWYVLFGLFLFVDLFSMDNLVKISTSKPFFNFYTDFGGLYIYYTVAFFLCVSMAFVMLLNAFKNPKYVLRHNQIKYMFLATFFGFGGGSAAFLPVFNIKVYPFGMFAVILYPALMTYSIIKYQLLEIEVVIRRTAVFAGLFMFVYGTFTVVTILGEGFYRNILGWHQWMAMIPTVLIITLALRPHELFLTNATDRFLFQKKYDYRELLKTFTNEILTVLDLKRLMEQTVAGLVRIMKLQSACVLMLHKDAREFKLVAGAGLKEEVFGLGQEDPLISYLRFTRSHILRETLREQRESDRKLKESMKKLDALLALPISLDEEMIGVICLGIKKSGEDYNQEDVDILTTLARTEAIAISNARLFDELSKTQAEAAQKEKMAVIGTLAAGINHEICNPLGIARGQCELFLLNVRDGFYKGRSKEEILKLAEAVMSKAIKETDRATAITKRLSSFAKPSTHTEIEEVVVETEVEEVLALIGHDLKLNNIDLTKDFPRHFPPILADRKQVQEIFFNIIRNAAQAIDKKQGKIVVSGFSEGGTSVIRISDNGCGISADGMEQIYNPFYTTKAPGSGTGLGLFIVRQIVERNRGTIDVQSEEGIGTTFTLRFPPAPVAEGAGRAA
ncbi:MAG: GAF domain-containing protein [Candidatus Omnitrophica bacterium]|nr:GAF domain-containing protein [Candidatus Omnitrophota bacterium]